MILITVTLSQYQRFFLLNLRATIRPTVCMTTELYFTLQKKLTEKVSCH